MQYITQVFADGRLNTTRDMPPTKTPSFPELLKISRSLAGQQLKSLRPRNHLSPTSEEARRETNPRSVSLLPSRPCLLPSAKTGGANRDRTGDLLLAKQALSQLSYGPVTPSRSLRFRSPLTRQSVSGGSGWI